MVLGLIIILFFIFLITVLGFKRAFFVYFCYNFMDYGLIAIRGLQFKHIILALFFINSIKIFNKNKEKYPFMICTLVFVIPFIVCNILSTFTGRDSWTSIFITIVQNTVIPFVLFNYIKTKNDLNTFIKYFLTLCFIICLYAYLEIILGTSPIVNFIHQNNGDAFNPLDGSFRFGGIKSTQSFFIHSTTFGYVSFCLLSFCILFLDKCKYELNLKWHNLLLVIIMLMTCVLFSGSRSSIAGLFILFGFVFFRRIFYQSKLNLKFILVLLVISFLIYNYLYEYIYSIIDSIINSDNSKLGSSTSMRQGQFLVGITYMLQNPVFGNGSGYTFGHVIFIDKNLFGAESIWITTAIDLGLFGVLSYLLCYFLIYKNFNHDKLPKLFYLLLFLFINSITSVPGMYFDFVLSMFVIINRMDKLISYGRSC